VRGPCSRPLRLRWWFSPPDYTFYKCDATWGLCPRRTGGRTRKPAGPTRRLACGRGTPAVFRPRVSPSSSSDPGETVASRRHWRVATLDESRLSAHFSRESQSSPIKRMKRSLLHTIPRSSHDLKFSNPKPGWQVVEWQLCTPREIVTNSPKIASWHRFDKKKVLFFSSYLNIYRFCAPGIVGRDSWLDLIT
jgi:hypothetical protein